MTVESASRASDSPDADVADPAVGAPSRPAAGLAFLGCVAVAVAAALRLPFLVGFGIDDDEFYTLRNALDFFADPTPDAVARYPLLFLFTRAGVELAGIVPVALRWFPFVCGVLAVAMIVRPGARLVSPSAAVAAAFLVALWPWHQYWSGTARYYAPLFLAGIGMIDAVDRVLDRSRAALAELGLWLLCAVLVHPAALFGLLGAGALFLDPERRRRAGRRALVVLGGAAVVLPAALFLSGTWENVERVLSREGGEGADAIQLVFNLAFNLSLPLVALSALGALALWREARGRAIYLLVAGGAPVALLCALAALGQGVQGRYAMVGFPAVLLLAGRGLTALAERARGLPSRVAVSLACVIGFVPGLVSNLRDGDRHDVAAAAAALSPLLRGDQYVYAEGHGLLGIYLFGFDRRMPSGLGQPPFPVRFGEAPAPARELTAIVRDAIPGLFVVPERALAATSGDDGAFARWLRERARVIRRIGSRRYDYHRNTLVLLAVDGGGRS